MAAMFVILFVSILLGLLSSTSTGLDLKSNRRSRYGVNSLPDKDKVKVSVAVVMPYSMFKERDFKEPFINYVDIFIIIFDPLSIIFDKFNT